MADPIALVGAACRFPGAPDLNTFWTLVAEGRDATREVDADRWPETRRPPIARGGFLETIADFDALAFAMSPTQAAETDPQQRLMLEVAVEALEDARLGPPDLRDHTVGVYIGIGASEYDGRFVDPTLGARGLHSGLGNDSSFAAGRIASLLGLRGPALALNTACSSALVALDQATKALRSGGCEIAVVGAVNLLVIPENSARLHRMGVLALDGRCKVFDRSADGYARAEGAGAIVLARVEVASALALPVRAHVLGTAVNQDAGETGLTAPSQAAQAAVIDQALRDAGLTPADIDVVEAHGTGTPTGDPVELEALGRAFADRTAPLPVGSVKSNIGHLEVAAGMAGLLKGVGMLERGEALPHRVHDTPVMLPRPLCLAGSGLATSSQGARALERIGVSAFGLSGTNAHAVLGRAETVITPSESTSDRPRLLVASASSEMGLRTLAAALAGRIEGPSFHAFAASTALTRRPLAHRMTVVATSPAAARSAFQSFASTGRCGAGTEVGTAAAAPLTTLRVGALEGDWAPFIERLRHWPAFRSIVEQADAPLPLVAAVALATQWKAFGWSFQRVEGMGSGRLAASVIRGDRTLAEALANPDPPDMPDGPSSTAHDEERLYVIGEDPAPSVCAATAEMTEADLLASVAAAWCAGVPVAWDVVYPELPHRVGLPPTPWQPTRAWIDDPPAPRVTESRRPPTSPELDPPGPTYQRSFRPLPALPVSAKARSWVIIADHQGVAHALARTLEPPPRVLQPRPIDAETWQPELGDLSDAAGVIFLSALDQRSILDDQGGPVVDAAEDTVRATWLAARWARAILEAGVPTREADEGFRFWIATRGAVAAEEGDAVDPTHGALWGLGATLSLEHPELGVGLVDLDPAGSVGGLAALLGVTTPEDQIALRGDHALAARLTPATPPPPMEWGPGPVLITGGLGALGLHIAETLADRGVRRIELASRRPPSPAASARLQALTARGLQIAVHALDVGDAAAVTAWAQDHRPTGWIHAAGILEDGIAMHLTPARIEATFHPKVRGALTLTNHLHDLERIVFCTSMAGLVGSMGQASYAAANAWLDAFAAAPRFGGTAVAVALGPMAEVGMAAAHETRLAKNGVLSMSPQATAQAVVDATGPSPLLVASLDFERMARRARARPVLNELLDGPSPTSDAPSDDPSQSRDRLEAWLVDRISTDLGLPPHQLEPRRPLTWHGFDSLMAIELKRSLDAAIGTSLPSAPFLSGPSLQGLVDALAPMVVRQGPPSAGQEPSFARVPSLTAVRPTSTGPGLSLVRLDAAPAEAPPLPVPVQIGLGAVLVAGLGLAWFLV
ncbi:MAG: SDR family NAD(P)-dependent oxidoreductase [Myxococcota bacterium]